MKHGKLTPSEQAFADRVRSIEERLFPDQLDLDDSCRMKSDRYSWHYRPSHQIETGLLTEDDVKILSKPGKRLLSVGAYPAFFERALSELGIPAENIVIADIDPAIKDSAGGMQTIAFDMTAEWPEIGMFDLIIFPESLCISLSNKVDREFPQYEGLNDKSHSKDIPESNLLSTVLLEALKRLKSGGVIRANGPMSHPNVIRMVHTKLQDAGHLITMDYTRYLLTVRQSDTSPSLTIR